MTKSEAPVDKNGFTMETSYNDGTQCILHVFKKCPMWCR